MAENDGKIYITISDRRFGKNTVDSPSPSSGGSGGRSATPRTGNLGIDYSGADKLLASETKYIEHEGMHILKQTVNKFISYGLGNIGNFSGNYIIQQDVNNLLSNAQGFINIGVMTLAGAKYGPVGAVTGLGIGIISQITSSVLAIRQRTIEVSKNNYEIEQLKARSGLNALIDGSRGTEN